MCSSKCERKRAFSYSRSFAFIRGFTLRFWRSGRARPRSCFFLLH